VSASIPLSMALLASAAVAACSSGSASSQCERYCACLCSIHDTPLISPETAEVMCQTCEPEQACGQGTPEDQCQATCRQNLAIFVAEATCTPPAESGAVDEDTSAARALELAAPLVAEWSADGELIGLVCHKLNADGRCRGWSSYWKSGADAYQLVYVIRDLAPWRAEKSFVTDAPLPETWLDTTDIAETAWAEAPDTVDIASATLSMAGDVPRWVVGFCHMQGATRMCDGSVILNARTGEVIR
jgi:hypothetical protein